MNKYLEDLEKAFKNVDEDYYSSFAFDGGSFNEEGTLEDRNEYIQYVERVFAYELYHQFRIIIDSNLDRYEGLKLNAEITKNGFNETSLGKERIFPDLVLHKSQTNNEYEYQKLFIEIKVQPSSDLKEDIHKMIVAVSEKLNFQNAIIICINMGDISIKKKIKNALNEVEQDSIEKLWLLSKEGYTCFNQILTE